MAYRGDRRKGLAPRACRRIGAFLLLASFLPAPAPALAEVERVRVEYSAPARCPDEAAFLRAVRQRTGRFQLASGTEPTRTFVVSLEAAETSVTGRLEINGPGTAVSAREISGKTCDEVTAALALMAALAVDPNASAAKAVVPGSPSQSASTPAGAGKPGTASRGGRASVAEAATPPAPAPAPLVAAPARAPIEERPAPSAARGATASSESAPRPDTVAALPALASPSTAPGWRWAVGAQGGVSLRVSPSTGLGGQLFAEAAAPGAGWWSPVLRAGLFLNRSDTTAASGAGAELAWVAAMVEGCPLRLATASARFALYPCLAAHLGVLRGRGRGLDRPETTTTFWPDVGPVVRLRVAAWARLSFEAQGMLVFPLRRVTFDARDGGPSAPPTTVFAVPAVGALAGIGVSYGLE